MGQGCRDLRDDRSARCFGFAVITTTSYRDGPTATTGTFGPLSAGSVSLNVGGLTVSLMQISPTSLSINGVAMVRCTP